MPRIITDLGGFSHYTWVTAIYIIAEAVIVPIIGKLTDMYGRKWFFIGGICIFVVGSLLCGFSKNIIHLIIFRAIQGIGGGIMMANAFTIIGDLFPPNERGKYQGLNTGVFGISSVIGPTIGGFLTDFISWHSGILYGLCRTWTRYNNACLHDWRTECRTLHYDKQQVIASNV